MPSRNLSARRAWSLPGADIAVKCDAMRPILLVALGLLCACSDGRQVTLVGTTQEAGSSKSASLTPEQLATGLDDLTLRIRERINNVSDRIDEGASNDIRRRTLRFRMRASEVAWRSVQNPNHLAGLVELWLWMASVDEYAKTPRVREAIGERVTLLQETASQVHADVEAFARRALPGKGFASIKADIDKASANGDLLSATPQREQAIIGDLLEVTRLQNVLGLALSPFEALRSGGDAAASLSVTANRAVDLMERYPEIIAWNLRLAVIDMEEQDSAREARAALQQSLKLIEEMPARIRAEIQTILTSSDPTLKEAQATLRDLTAATAALTSLSGSLQQTAAAVHSLYPEPDPPGTPPKPAGRPFDIREYTDAVEAAATTLKEARLAIETATSKGVPAAEAAAARFEAAADRVLWRVGGLLAFAALLAAGVLILHHRLRRKA